jgi:outer membrane protein assembly factor BamB
MNTKGLLFPSGKGGSMGAALVVVLVLVLVVVLVLVLVAVSGCSNNNGASTDGEVLGVYGPGWSAVHADSSNTDYSPVVGARDLELAWSRQFSGGTINLGPTSDDEGRVFVTTTAPGCHLYALSRETGETLWCSQEINQSAVSSGPLLDNEGHVFVSDNVTMFAFDRQGNVLWRTPILGFTLSAQFTPSGHILFVTHIGRIYVLDRKTGANVIEPVDLIPGATYDPFSNDQPVLACMRGTAACPAANTIAVDQHTGRFYFTFFAPGAGQAGLRAMQYSDDPEPSVATVWTNDALPGGSGSSPVLSADNQRLYVNDNVDSIHALDVRTGEFIWSYAIGWASGGSPSVSPEGLIIPTGGGPLLALQDRGDKAEQLWRAEQQNRSIAAQAAGDIAYPVVVNPQSQLDILVIDTRTGEELDRESLPGLNTFTVGTTIGLDGTVLVPTFRARLVAYRPAGSGKPTGVIE